MRFLYGFTGSAASTIWFSEKFYKFEKNRKPVARRNVVGGIAQSPHGHRAKADPRTGCVQFSCEGRSPHGLRTIFVRRLRRLHGNCTDIAGFP